MLTRRDLVKNLLLGGSAATLVAGMAGYGGLQQILFGRPAFAASLKPLAVPPVLGGENRDGVRVYDLNLQKGTTPFYDGVNTPTLGINGSYLGPTLKMRAGDTVRLNVTNKLGQNSTLHWHGFHLPAYADGGPHQIIKDGATWSPQFEVKQRASMFWYHSHLPPVTGPQVYQGLAGLIYVDDEETGRLGLPSEYGVDDIPLALQDRAFDDDGSLFYSGMMMGVMGDVMLVNGGLNPYFEAKTQKLRLRVINASNARFYSLGFSDARLFSQIGTDGGLLERPLDVSRISLAPGERAQVIVDLSDGRPVVLRAVSSGSGPVGSEQVFDVLRIQPDLERARVAALPSRLVTLDPPDPAQAIGTRPFVLGMGMTINGKRMDRNRIDETVRLGTTEIWEMSNTSMVPHPFHVHDVQFRILDRNGSPPARNERGLKDTVVVNPGERVRVLLSFTDYSDPYLPYMYHCHNLEHEDTGMMGQFVVTG